MVISSNEILCKKSLANGCFTKVLENIIKIIKSYKSFANGFFLLYIASLALILFLYE